MTNNIIAVARRRAHLVVTTTLKEKLNDLRQFHITIS